MSVQNYDTFNVVIFGHSFVSGFKHYLSNQMKNVDCDLTLESFAPQFLGLDHFVSQIILYGESGATIMDDFTLPSFIQSSNGFQQ